MSAGFGDHLFFVLIGLVMPVVVLLQPAASGEVRGISRPRTYLLSLAMLALPSASVVTMWLAHGRPLASLGLGTADGEWAAAAKWIALGLTAAGAILVSLAHVNPWVRSHARGWVEDSQEGVLGELLPRTRSELALFAAIVPVAAFAEEILFRAFMQWYLALVLPWWGALAVCSAIFGLCHGYQGPGGIARTAAFGVLLGGVYLAGGALWPVVILHSAVNLTTAGLAWVTRRQEGQTVDSI